MYPDYQFKFKEAFASTVLGTTPSEQANLPKTIPISTHSISLYEDRDIPSGFYIEDEMKFNVVALPYKAPLVFVIAGTGAGYNASKNKILQKSLYQAGISSIAISSPTKPDFMMNASEFSLPGYQYQDAKDIYKVMQATYEEVKDDLDVSWFGVTGYSLGGMNSAFVSLLDEQEKVFNFKKVMMINPPVNLYQSMKNIDKLAAVDLKDVGIVSATDFFEKVFASLGQHFKETGEIELTPTLLEDIYEKKEKHDLESIAGLIAIVFRFSSVDIVYTANTRYQLGMIDEKYNDPGTGTSTTEFFKYTYTRWPFGRYVDEILTAKLPEKLGNKTGEQLIQESTLIHIQDYLKSSSKIEVITNRNDPIYSPGDIKFFAETFDQRATILPYGGHCGNMNHAFNVKKFQEFFLSGNQAN
jgi:hypothetical protein